MKHTRVGRGLLVGACALGLSGAAYLGACGSDDDADSAADASVEAGPGPGIIPGCEPEPKDAERVLEERCGIFISPGGDDRSPGTRDKPKKTMAAAITATEGDGRRVYVCTGIYDEAVSITSIQQAASIYGGLSCEGGAWTYVGEAARATFTGSVRALVVKNAGGATVHVADVNFTARSATDPGESSIAAWIENATVSLSRVTLTAGNGAAGTVANPSPAALGPADAGANANGPTGGTLVTCTCGDGNTVGGSGGNAGASGGPGTPDLMGIAPKDGLGGTGGVADCASNGGLGHTGADGDAGPPGQAGSGLFLSGNTLLGQPGADGGLGRVAQGGGGGGGQAGQSGGSGGCGGCGGFGGAGGQGGGASVGLVSLDADVALMHVQITTATGGQGGIAAAGQAGQPGGNPGLALCSGGNGGTGGQGGPGGAGAGGASAGIVYRGQHPKRGAGVEVNVGAGGPGGAAAPGGEAGAKGEAAEVVEIKP